MSTPKPKNPRQRKPLQRKKKTAATKRPVGRPSKFSPDFLDRVKGFCLLGLTNVELAQKFNVTERQFQKWIATKPAFAQAIRNGRENADQDVANALYLKATGRWTQPAVKIATKIEIVHDGKGGLKEVKSEHIVPYVEHFPPDTAAAFIWLKNRHPERWRDKKEVHETSDVRHSGKITYELSEEARRWINEDLAEMGVPVIEPPAKGNGKANGKATRH